MQLFSFIFCLCVGVGWGGGGGGAGIFAPFMPIYFKLLLQNKFVPVKITIIYVLLDCQVTEKEYLNIFYLCNIFKRTISTSSQLKYTYVVNILTNY